MFSNRGFTQPSSKDRTDSETDHEVLSLLDAAGGGRALRGESSFSYGFQ